MLRRCHLVKIYVLIASLHLSSFADAVPRSPARQTTASPPAQETRILPTSQDDCRSLSLSAMLIARGREKGLTLKRARAMYTHHFVRDRSSTTFSPFARATILGWLLQDLYGPAALLSSSQVLRATEIWCRTALATSRPERVPFTFALLKPDLLEAISGCTANVGLGQVLVRLRNYGVPLPDTMAILREGMAHGVIIGGRPHMRLPHYDIMKAMEDTRHKIAEHVRVLGHVAAAMYADTSLMEEASSKEVDRLCLEAWLP